ncbi:MAG TPA: nitronate monooxygenase [Streptosporangiaceae bacterium]|jgi:nitronate monooxygenase
MTRVLSALEVPVVQAPMAGGPSTPQLAAAVNRGGGLGFLAAGYLTAGRLVRDIGSLRGLTDRAFGVNVFTGSGHPASPAEVAAYAARLAATARRAGAALGEPRFDDDGFDDKVAALIRERAAVVSFTFGLPPRAVVESLRAGGSEVWLTVTSAAEATAAAGLGADALIVQGVEAGGHRGVFTDDDSQSDLTVLAALQLIRAAVDLPLVAAGAIMTGGALAAVLAAGAAAGQAGTAYLRAAEAGTSPVQRDATASDVPTVLTRAFSGRLARGIANRWHAELGEYAPRAYPEVHYLTSPLRAAGRQASNPDLVNLWAGQAHQLAAGESAEEITRRLGREARQAVTAAAARLGAG